MQSDQNVEARGAGRLHGTTIECSNWKARSVLLKVSETFSLFGCGI